MVISRTRPSKPADGSVRARIGSQDTPLTGAMRRRSAKVTSSTTVSTNSGMEPSTAMAVMSDAREGRPVVTLRIRGQARANANAVANIVDDAARVTEVPRPDHATDVALRVGLIQEVPKLPLSVALIDCQGVVGRSRVVRRLSRTSGSGARSASRARNTAMAGSRSAIHGSSAVMILVISSSTAAVRAFFISGGCRR